MTPSSSGSSYVVSPAAERAPAPAESRAHDTDISAPAGASSRITYPSPRLDPTTALDSDPNTLVARSSPHRSTRVPVPMPYRSSSRADSSRPEAQRAVDRYRDAVETGEWARLRSRLDGPTALRATTTRNLDRLVERYAGVPGAARRLPNGIKLDDRYSSRGYRYAYDRGPLDRLARPGADELRQSAGGGELATAGATLSRATRASLAGTTGAISGASPGANDAGNDGSGGATDDNSSGDYDNDPDYYWNNSWYYGGGFSWGWGPFGCGPYGYLGYGNYFFSSLCWWWHPSYNNYGYSPLYGWPTSAYGYHYTPPVYYPGTINNYYTLPYEDEQPEAEPATIVIIESDVQDQGEPSVIVGGTVPLVSTAADSYLTLGDRAFREGRYADAVHFYAKASELEPDVAVFYLVLSDALFATGDYGYAAFAINKALEQEPELVESNVDKRTFYSDPTEFDRQLAVLELYLEDHPADEDARIVLAANLLFSGAPATAVDVLESDLAGGLTSRSESAGLILARAQTLQYGE